MLTNAANSCLDAGLCVLPARRSQKRPAVRTWKQYQQRLPTTAELSAWMANNPDAICILCGENHEDPVITLPAVEWATAFAMHQTRRQLFLAQSYVAENPFHAECLKVVRKLREMDGQQMQRQHLLRFMRCKAADFDQIVATLMQQGEVVPVDIPTKTKTAQGYRLA